MRLTVSTAKPYERAWAGDHRIRSLIAMVHPRAVLIFSLSTVAVAWTAQGYPPSLSVGFELILAMAMVQASIGIWNEVCDRDLDAAAKPWRAIPAGMIGVTSAAILALVTGVLGLSVASRFSERSMLLLGVAWAAGLAYSALLKRSVYSWVPYLIAYPLVPVWVWATLNRLELRSLLVFAVAPPLVVGIHFCNQLRDYEEDRASGVRSTVHLLGMQKAERWCRYLVLSSPIPMLLSLPFSRRPSLWPAVVAAAVLHWIVIRQYAPERQHEECSAWQRGLFRRLQLTGCVLTMGWLLTF